MTTDVIKDRLVETYPATTPSEWKRATKRTVPEGIERRFVNREHDLSVLTLEDRSGIKILNGEEETAPASLSRKDFDAAIIADFQQPAMAYEGYKTWEDLMADYAFEHPGELLAGAMVSCFGPTPRDFYDLGLHANLHGLMDVEYLERDGQPGYQMDVDRSEGGTLIWVTKQADRYVTTVLATRPLSVTEWTPVG